MADKIRRVDYCYVEVPDRPGEGARVLAALREQGVSLLSMTAFPRAAGNAQIDLVAGKGMSVLDDDVDRRHGSPVVAGQWAEAID